VSGILQILVASKTVAGGGSLSASADTEADAVGFSPPFTQSLTTNTVTVTATGGTAPYTHSWAFVSGNNVFTVSSGTSASVSWSATVGAIPRAAVWRDTVTDALSASVVVDVNVTAVVE
jgi:hypothetical protein